MFPTLKLSFLGFVQTIPPKTPNSNSRVPQKVKWKLPLRSYFKINLDRVVFKEENATGISVVIRDEKGHVMASMAKKILLPNSVAIYGSYGSCEDLNLCSGYWAVISYFGGRLRDSHQCPKEKLYCWLYVTVSTSNSTTT